MSDKIARKGFTLAEVLITLGVIGVVAAMTIPTLIANINGSRYRNQFKKSISTLSQASLMSKAQYGFDFAEASATTGVWHDDGLGNPETETSMFALFSGTVKGLSSLGLITMPGSSIFCAGDGFFYQINDGTIFGFCPGMVGADPNCHLNPGEDISKLNGSCVGYIDVNGTTLPNKEVQCSNGDTKDVFDANYQDCVVKNRDITDRFPVVFHDSVVEPGTNAARYVLNTAK
ncbi:type II secretion system protein [bacterium]|nr:type II secretion system protein [bacterium]